MNRTGDDLAARIDSLVAGECDEAERRALLILLENEPDGWRRCALAFLEDQTWRAALGSGMALSAPAPAPAPITPPIIPRSARPLAPWAMAAGLLIATFLGGLKLGGRSAERIVTLKTTPDRMVSNSMPTEGEDQIRAVGWATVDNQGTSPRRVPIFAGPGLDDEWLKAQPSTVPEYLRAQWERSGYQVAEHRQLMSLNLEDGRHLAIPIEGVEVQYVGQSTY